jgi:hypothetical protein
MELVDPVYVCPYCGRKNRYSDCCDLCWNVTRNLAEFIQHEKGREFVEETLRNA